MKTKSLFFLIVLLVCSLSTVYSNSLADNPSTISSYYSDEHVGDSMSQNIVTLLKRRIFPSIYGALVLLFFSALFSTINFYSALPAEQRSFRKSIKYLFFWVGVNYIFAMIFLLLILPVDVKMNDVTKTFLLYCLVATALPELSANIRLQFGQSKEQALDLHKYKIKVSEIISHQLSRSLCQKLKQDLDCIESYFTDRFPQLRDKLSGFVRQSNSDDNEKQGALQVLQDCDSNTCRSLLTRFMWNKDHSEHLLEFFREEIESFRNSPVFSLMSELKPMVDVVEARKIVQNGVTSPRQFVRRTYFAYQRRSLSKETGIEVERLNLVHFSTRKFFRKKRLTKIKIVSLLVGVCIMITYLIYNQTARTYSNYYPENTIMESFETPLPETFKE